jgi:hypothetical protein
VLIDDRDADWRSGKSLCDRQPSEPGTHDHNARPFGGMRVLFHIMLLLQVSKSFP